MPLEPRTPAQSRVEMTQIVMPSHLNANGSMFGGIVVQWIDVAAAVAAMRHAGSNTVTASIDGLDFLSPIRLGDVVLLKAQVNYVGRTSMEVGCKVLTEHPGTREQVYTTKAYLTFVALDEQGPPRPVPPLQPQSETEPRRFFAAQQRRAQRLSLAAALKARHSAAPPSD